MKRDTNEIFRILEKDGLASSEQISTMTDIPVAEVEKLIKQAEADRAILKYKAVVNWEKLEDEQVWALIEVKMVLQPDVGFDTVAERIYRFSEARSVYLVSGAYDLAVMVTGKTMHEVANFVTQKLAPLPGVQSTVTHFLLRKYKEDGEIIGGREEVRRLVVAP